MRRALLLALVDGPGYRWRSGAPSGGELAQRFAPPAGTTRMAVAPGSFGDWLRHLPLLPPGAQVHLFDGRLKARQDVHLAVVDLDVGTRDLQQCADAVMRLRAEYLFASGAAIAFHPDPGKPRAIAWPAHDTDRRRFEKYLVRVFADAGTASLAAELGPAREPAPGDVLIQGGYPGHAILVLDVAIAADGRRYLMLGQSYMPAQQFHVLKAADGSPWFAAAFPLATPEWRPFAAADLKRF